MMRLAICELLVVCCVFTSVESQETSHAKYGMPHERPSEYTFFFRRPAQNPSENPVMLTTTPFPQTSTTQKEFTGIAFPPQIFEILTGSEPSTQNLGGRKNATLLLMINTTDNQEQNLQPPQNVQPAPPLQQFSTNSSQLPEIINGATRPPTRFPPGNKPSFVRPTQKPSATTTTQGYGQPNFGIYNNNNLRPIAAAPHTTTPAPDNRVGAPTTVVTRAPPTQRPRPPPSPPSTGQPLIIGGQYGEPPSFKYKDVLRSVRGITQYLQEALLTPSAKGVALWDGVNSNFLLSPLGVGLTMTQMLMAGGTRAKSHLRDILRIHAKSDTNEQFRSEVVYHKSFGDLARSLQRCEPSTAISPVWTRGNSAPYTLAVDTAVFVQSTLMVRPTFIHSMETIYNSRINPVDFRRDPYGSLAVVNRWAEEVSRGKIKNFLVVPPSPNTAALFASSLYFKAAWRNPLNEMLTSIENFHVTPEETISALFMKGEINNGSKFIDSTKFGVKGVRLAYNNTDEVAFYMFLPKNESTNMQEFAKRLLRPYIKPVLNQRYDSSNFPPNKNFQDPLPQSWETHKQSSSASANPALVTRTDTPAEMNDKWELDEIIASMKEKSVILSIPKITLRGSIRLNPPGSGGKDQLSGMLEDSAQSQASSVGAILHDTFLLLSESGTEAAAVTSGALDYIKVSETFKADRPFMILLRHELTGIPLFWGAICRPFITSQNERLSV